MNRTYVAAATLLYALGVTVPQVAALLWLPTEEFGHFSLIYLTYALAGSFLLSTVNEAWSRSGMTAGRGDFLRAGSFISATFGAAAAALGIILHLGPLALAAGAAGVYFAAAWSSSRYYHAARGTWKRLAISELCGAGATIATLIILMRFDVDPLITTFSSWASCGFAALVTSSSLATPAPKTAIRWISQQRGEIAVLLPDSLLLDLGSIGAPLLLFPFLGADSFGRYRAISNVAFPVRLILSAVRPALARVSPTKLSTPVAQSALVSLAALIGLCAGSFVVLVARNFPGLGVISDIGEYAIQIGAFVAATTYSSVIYMLCRIWSTRKILILGRIIQTALMVVFPIAGMAIAHERGAINGYVLGSLLLCANWAIALRRSRAKVPGYDS